VKKISLFQPISRLFQKLLTT